MGEDILDFSDRCRLCIEPKRLSIDIFSEEGRKIKLKSKINKHLSLQVSRSDGLPNHICYQCLFRLETWVNFKHLCTERDKVLKTWSFVSHNDSRTYLGASHAELEEDLRSGELETDKGNEQAPSKLQSEVSQERSGVLDAGTHTHDNEASLGSYAGDMHLDEASTEQCDPSLWENEDDKVMDVDLTTGDSVTSQLDEKSSSTSMEDNSVIQRTICPISKDIEMISTSENQQIVKPNCNPNPERNRRKPLKPNKMLNSEMASSKATDIESHSQLKSLTVTVTASEKTSKPHSKGHKIPSPKPMKKSSPNGSPLPIKRKRGRPSKASLQRERELKLLREKEKHQKSSQLFHEKQHQKSPELFHGKQHQKSSQLFPEAKHVDVKTEVLEKEEIKEIKANVVPDYTPVVKEESGVTEIVLDDPDFGSMKFTLSVVEIESPVTSPTPMEEYRQYAESCSSSCGHMSSDSQVKEDFEGFESPDRFSTTQTPTVKDQHLPHEVGEPSGHEEHEEDGLSFHEEYRPDKPSIHDRSKPDVSRSHEEHDDELDKLDASSASEMQASSEHSSINQPGKLDLLDSQDGAEDAELARSKNLNQCSDMPRSKTMGDVRVVDDELSSPGARNSRKRSSSMSECLSSNYQTQEVTKTPGIYRITSGSNCMTDVGSLENCDKGDSRKTSILLPDDIAYSDNETNESPNKRLKISLSQDASNEIQYPLSEEVVVEDDVIDGDIIEEEILEEEVLEEEVVEEGAMLEEDVVVESVVEESVVADALVEDGVEEIIDDEDTLGEEESADTPTFRTHTHITMDQEADWRSVI